MKELIIFIDKDKLDLLAIKGTRDQCCNKTIYQKLNLFFKKGISNTFNYHNDQLIQVTSYSQEEAAVEQNNIKGRDAAVPSLISSFTPDKHLMSYIPIYGNNFTKPIYVSH